MIKKIEKEILIKYELARIQKKLKEETNQKKKILSKLLDYEKQIFDFMYSKLNDLDKKHVDKLIKEKRKCLN